MGGTMGHDNVHDGIGRVATIPSTFHDFTGIAIAAAGIHGSNGFPGIATRLEANA